MRPWTALKSIKGPELSHLYRNFGHIPTKQLSAPAVMLAEIVLEALQFFGRADLEGLQMHSRYLRDLVDHNRRTLPLRYVYDVNVNVGISALYLIY